MLTILIIFYVSLAGMAGMLALKSWSIRSGRPTLVAHLGSYSDGKFHSIMETFQGWLAYLNKKTFIALAQWIAYHVLVHIRHVYVEIKAYALANPHSRKVIDMVRGRREVRDHGASFYLRKISQEREVEEKKLAGKK